MGRLLELSFIELVLVFLIIRMPPLLVDASLMLFSCTGLELEELLKTGGFDDSSVFVMDMAPSAPRLAPLT